MSERRFFVGRDRQIEAILARLRGGADRGVEDVRGIHGIGKSWFLDAVAERAAADAGATVLRINVGEFVPNPPTGEDQVNQLLVESFSAYQNLLAALVRQLPGRNPEFTTLLARARLSVERINFQARNQFKVGWFSRVENVAAQNQEFAVYVAEHRAEAIRAGRAELDDDIIRRLESWSGGGPPLLVLVDELEKVAGQSVEGWIGSLLRRLRGCVVVTARAQAEVRPDEPPPTLPLPNFTAEEVDRYLRRRMDAGELPDGLVDEVVRFCGGHPQAVGIAADLISDRLREDPGRAIGPRMFRDLGDDLDRDMNQLVNNIIDEITDRDLRSVLDQAWVLRSFDAAALRHLIVDETGAPIPRGKLRVVMDKLERYSFVERRAGPRPDAVVYRFHEFLREKRESYLAMDPDEYESLHDRARAFYRARLDEWEMRRDATAAYLGWYKYEHPEWQALLLEWMYHAGRIERDRTAAQIDFTTFFLDAFWWWGWYVQFSFCDRILDEWEDVASRFPEDRPWMRALRQFHDHYPTQWEGVDDPRWEVVDESMWTIRDLARLDGDASAIEDHGRRHLRALTSIFLAHASRHLLPDDDEADGHYADAHAMLVADGDVWNEAWVVYERGDLDAERGRPKLARERCQEAFDAARSARLDDPELAANAVLRLGDLDLREGRHASGFDHCAEALVLAYEFQVKPMPNPHPPDEYTRFFYLDVVSQVAALVCRTAADGGAGDAAAGCLAIRTAFAPYWDEVRADVPADLQAWLGDAAAEDLEALLAPPAPALEDLQDEESEYYRQTRRLVRAIRRRRPVSR
jgi:hypothetical protein